MSIIACCPTERSEQSTKVAIKREQKQCYIDYAEREQLHERSELNVSTNKQKNLLFLFFALLSPKN